MDTYLNISNYKNGEIISKLIVDAYNMATNTNTNVGNIEHIETIEPINILFVRTPTTGKWLDHLFVNTKQPNITRILYYTSKTVGFGSPPQINHNYSFHEFSESNRDFMLLASLLTPNGTIISHDCFPPTKNMATARYKKGNWCGETYMAFVNFAYNHPEYYYTVLPVDTGIGIASKINCLDLDLKTNLDKNKQQQLILLYQNQTLHNCAYDYFIEHSKELINAIPM